MNATRRRFIRTATATTGGLIASTYVKPSLRALGVPGALAAVSGPPAAASPGALPAALTSPPSPIEVAGEEVERPDRLPVVGEMAPDVGRAAALAGLGVALVGAGIQLRDRPSHPRRATAERERPDEAENAPSS